MASPVADNYSASSGATITAGRFAWPAWRLAMTPNTWAAIGTTLASIDSEDNAGINNSYPSNAIWHATVGQAAIINAWCGGCYDSANDVLWLPLGGGHNDYAGNEPYKIDISAESPAWEMVRNPSGAIGNLITLDDGQETTGIYSDGRPRAIHSYNKPCYVPGVGPVITVQGGTYKVGGSANGTLKPIVINETTGEGTFKTAGTMSNVDTSGSGSCYDPTRHALWYRSSGTGGFYKYDITGDSWAAQGSSFAVSGYSGLEYLPDYDCILWINSGLTNGFAVFDCATTTLYQPSKTGSLTGMSLSGEAQPRRFTATQVALWDNATSTTQINVMSFASNPRTDTWQISQLSVDGSNAVTPTAAAANGTYGRFFYSSNLSGFGVINSITDQIYFYAST